MDFREKLETRVTKLSNDLGEIRQKYNEIAKQEELKWYEFLKTPFGVGEASEINNYEYLEKNKDAIQEEFSKRLSVIQTVEEERELHEQLVNFFHAKKVLEETQAKRISFDKVETEKKIVSAKILYAAIEEMKQIVCEPIQKIDEQIADISNEIKTILYSDPKYVELNNKIMELKNEQIPFINHINLLNELANTQYHMSKNDVARYNIGEEYIEMYNFLADAVKNFQKFKDDEPTLLTEVPEVSFEKPVEEVSESIEIPESIEIDEDLEQRIEESMAEPSDGKKKDEDVSKDETIVNISDLKKLVENLDDEVLVMEPKEETKEEEEVLVPSNIKKRPSKVRKAVAMLSGVGVSAGSLAFGPAGPGVVMVASSVSKVAVKKALKKNEQREERLNELVYELSQYDEKLKLDIEESEKEKIRVKFDDSYNEAKAIQEKIKPDLKAEKFTGPSKVKSFTDAKDKLKAKISKLKAYLGSTEGLKEVNVFLNAAIVTSAGLSLHNGLTTLINLNKAGVSAGGIAGEILSNPGAVEFLENVDTARRMGGL